MHSPGAGDAQKPRIAKVSTRHLPSLINPRLADSDALAGKLYLRECRTVVQKIPLKGRHFQYVYSTFI